MPAETSPHQPGQRAGLVIAVDGPSGSGKSSVSRTVAERLGLRYLDTGAMYRAVCWWCRETGTELDDQDQVARAAREIDLQIGTEPRDPTVRVGSKDVARAIRDPLISATVSAVATNQQVRAELQRRQREIIAAASAPGCPGIVAEGRDITTVVAPHADVRVLLTADAEARLARRAAQDAAGTDDAAREATRDQVLRRDRDDSTVSQFHTAADGVVTVDSSGMDLEQTVQAVLHLVRSSTRRHEPTPETEAHR